MTNHVFCHIDGNVLAAVMDSNRMTDEGGEDGRGSRPGLQNFLLTGFVKLFHALVEFRSNKRAFLNTSAHVSFPPYLPLRRLMMNLLVGFFALRVFRPIAGLPHGVTGPGRPTGARPSPPPCG